MRVLIADKLPQTAVASLEQSGFAVTVKPELSTDTLPQAIADHDVLVVRSTKVTRATLEQANALQLVVRAGAGTNTIDVATASARGIFVANCPGKNAIAVAELTLGLLLCVDRQLVAACTDLRAGRWNKKRYSRADGLFGKRLGVVGMGQIGKEVAARARAIGLRVGAWSRSLSLAAADELGVRRFASLGELAENSDIVSVHLAYSPDTKHAISADFLARLPAGAVLINTSRGGIADEAAVLQAIEQRGLRYATDVFDSEPGEGEALFEHPLARHPNVVCTPHIGASTEQAQAAVAEETLRILRTFKTTGQVLHCVNLCAQSPARWQLNVRHLDRVGVLANVLGCISKAGINVEELENVIFDGATAACARIRLGSEPTPQLLAAIGATEHVIDASALAL